MPRNRSEKVEPPEVDATGSKFWYRDGKLHREDGPAVEYADGGKFWFRDGKKHRNDGPAVEYATGDKQWYLNGEFIRSEPA